MVTSGKPAITRQRPNWEIGGQRWSAIKLQRRHNLALLSFLRHSSRDSPILSDQWAGRRGQRQFENHFQIGSSHHRMRCEPPRGFELGTPERVGDRREDMVRRSGRFPILARSIFQLPDDVHSPGKGISE